MHQTESINTITEHLFRQESGKMLSVLSRYLGIHEVQLAEDIVQETLIAAFETWRHRGVPDNPRAWLYRTAKNKTIDALRRSNRFRDRVVPVLQQSASLHAALDTCFLEPEISDATLRMMFVCCHPTNAPAAQIALMLKILCGMSVKEIAIGFQQSEESVARRIHRAKEKLKLANVELTDVNPPTVDATDTVLRALYLLFNEGYKSATSPEVIRQDLCTEAIRLTLLLVHHPDLSGPKVHALLALMAFQAARQPARINPDGELVPIDEQDRTLWNGELIQVGYAHFAEANKTDILTSYHIEAGVASYHISATDFRHTNWKAIVQAYQLLYQIAPSQIVGLQKAIAIGYAEGPEAGIEALNALDMPNHSIWLTALADFYQMAKQPQKAMDYYNEALKLEMSDSERKLIMRKRTKAEHSV